MSQHRQHYYATNARRTDWAGIAQAIVMCAAVLALFFIGA
jgi:hypothetical protein